MPLITTSDSQDGISEIRNEKANGRNIPFGILLLTYLFGH